MKFFPLIPWVTVFSWGENKYRCLSLITQCCIPAWSNPPPTSFFIVRDKSLLWVEKGGLQLMVAVQRGHKPEEEGRKLEAGLIPHCHYLHFLDTVRQHAGNECHFHGFTPGRGAFSAMITDAEPPWTLSVSWKVVESSSVSPCISATCRKCIIYNSKQCLQSEQLYSAKKRSTQGRSFHSLFV